MMLEGLNKIKLKLIKLIFVAGCILLSSCAPNISTKLDKKLSRLDQNSLILLSLSFEDKLNKDTCVSAQSLRFLIGDSRNGHYDKIKLAEKNVVVEYKKFKYFLIIFDLPPGNHYFYSIRGKIIKFLRAPIWEAPILLNFKTKENEIVYLGHIRLILREKVSENEFRAGPIIPLLDQAGIVNKTFDVVIVDNYEKDIEEFKKKFPKLTGQKIIKRILPNWKRPSSKEFNPKKTHLFFF